ncbi:hypothetical protein yfred0001_20510 [Yersinia frederiksenii ATCC 33641]|nr:hypothetical protein yfred0001_20510 [Yersinia frederiksenii ATCC 33641]
MPQAPESKKIIFRFKCRLNRQYAHFASTASKLKHHRD